MNMYNTTSTDLVCFSHLRWNFVYQRPQHLMTRFATKHRVFFIEEPVFGAEADFLRVTTPIKNVTIVTPHLHANESDAATELIQHDLIAAYFVDNFIVNYFFWYYTPMALAIGNSFSPKMIVYDCMDELSAFRFAPPVLKERETQLLAKADLVFTGGYSLYEAKKNRHHDVHAFPSSIDAAHFGRARTFQHDPDDQQLIPRLRIGFYGVIDERIDLELLEAVALRKPEWSFILIGPVVKISESQLPRLANIHYLGMKSYEELPQYVAGWDIAMMPFAHNESTRYISPTKTPEYLAAGKPVISTPINDVLRQYGRTGLVHIAGTADEFIRVALLLEKDSEREEWLEKVDDFLSQNSWDKTWQKMSYHINRKLQEKESTKPGKEKIYV